MADRSPGHFATARRWLWKSVRTLLVVGFVIYAVRIADSFRLPDLHPWHSVELESEFRADGGVASFAAYRELPASIFCTFF